MAFPKNMRWGSSEFRFVRPIRWIVLIWGDEALQLSFEGIEAGNLSRGHRTLGPSGPVSIKNAESYIDAMKSAGVIVDQIEREAITRAKIESVALELKGTAVVDEDLLEEVIYLVEYPTAFAGGFDEKYLELPEICITTPMQGHQRYFPVKRDGLLMNRFIAVRNGSVAGLDNVRHGNERVLAARLSDARFFFKDDMKIGLEGRYDSLSGVALAEGLGTMLDKTRRVTRLAEKIAEAGDAEGKPNAKQLDYIREAGKLMKCDLATNMVREFTELQGEIGLIYARLEGKPEEISKAIAEHYMPKVAGGELPASRIGAALAMADKADSLVGYFGIGQVPTGSADPFALRRSMLGLIAIHEARRPSIGLMDIMKEAIECTWPGSAPRPKGEIIRDLEEFATGRIRGQLLEEGHRYDLVEAAIVLGAENPALIRISLGALERDAAEGWMQEFGVAFIRVRNIAKNAPSAAYDNAAFTEAAEIELEKEYRNAEVEIRELLEIGADVNSYALAMSKFAALKPTIDFFFDEIMVMCEDEYIRKNRLGLIKAIELLALRLADFSKIVQ
jgi:glycyl-tRNA synthetase beta chain